MWGLAVIAGLVGFFWAMIELTIFSIKAGQRFSEAIADKPRIENAVDNVVEFLVPVIVVLILVGLLVVVPILMIMDTANIGLYQVIIYYLIGVSGIALTVGGAWGLIWLFFKYLPSALGDTVFGQFLVAKKKQFCPTLVACPIGKQRLSL